MNIHRQNDLALSSSKMRLRNNSYDNKKEINDLDHQKQIEEEAKELIQKTKHMMEGLSNDNEECVNKEKGDDMVQKILIKNKQIKMLEKELKEKNVQLKLAMDKISRKNEEIQKLNEMLNKERGNLIRAENVKLQKKMVAIEKGNEDNKRMYEKMIEELNNKLNEFIKKNEMNEKKILEMENNMKMLINENEKIQTVNENKCELIKQLNEKNEIEKKVNEKYKKQINDLKITLSNICILIKTLFTKETDFFNNRNKYIKKFHLLFTPTYPFLSN